VKDYRAALDSFMQAITLPAQAVSAVVVACIKMARLVNLIENGSALQIPKHASNIITTFSKQDMPVYDAIVKAFVADDATALKNAVANGKFALTQEHSLGLAKQVITALTRRKVLKLTSTYMTLRLDQIVAEAGFSTAAEAEKVLMNMIAGGEIQAAINQQTGIVRFGAEGGGSGATEKHQGQASQEVLARLERCVQASIDVSERLRELQFSLLTSPEYISKTQASFAAGFSIAGGRVRQADWPDSEDVDFSTA
jgi:PCI domain